MGPREVYDIVGDSEAAMRLLISASNSNGGGDGSTTNEQTPEEEYNCLLLTALATATTTTDRSSSDMCLLDESLDDARKVVLNSYSTSSKQFPLKRQQIIDEWILAYNRGLVLLAKGKVEESIREAWTYLQQAISGPDLSSESQQPPIDLSCRMGFLILEGMLMLYPTRMHGRTGTSIGKNNYDDGSSFDLSLLDMVLSWLTENVEKTEIVDTGENNDQDGHSSILPDPKRGDPELRFLLSVYNSRVDFFERSTGDTASRDKHMRSARKELKQAMEIFQHKLRPSSSQSASSGGGGGKVGGTNNISNTDSSSLASVSSYSEEVATATAGHSNINDPNTISKHTSPTPLTASVSSTLVHQSSSSSAVFNNSNSNLSRILQGQNQAALNLKANAEQLKGNAKKSLILCGEAQSFNSNAIDSGSSCGGNDSSTGYYDAIHQNNLGIVYETSGKSHLALHAFSKAIRSTNSCSNRNTTGFESDGTARPDVSLPILNNAAFCALKSRNYSAAYECYAIGLASSKSWRKRPRTWLRLSETCIGLSFQVKKERTDVTAKCSKVEIDGKVKGVIIRDTFKYNDDNNAASLPVLGSQEDLKGIKKHSLVRARIALEMALELFVEDGTKSTDLALQSTRLSLAYISLEERNFKKALDYSMLVLDDRESDDTTAQHSDDKSDIDALEDTTESVRHHMVKRQKATARMYASEARASLGDAMASMKLLVGDGKDDAFDRLASDLGGVTIDMASSNAQAKERLAKSQTMVRCSASAASSALGNVTASKQLAMSAQAMENSYSSSREGTSQARKALIYCMLREGNHGAALTLLRSAR